MSLFILLGRSSNSLLCVSLLRGQALVIGNKMHNAFPLPVRKFPLPEGTSHCLKKNATARRKVLPLLEVCTAIIVKEKPGDEDGNTTCVSSSNTTFPAASASVATISQDTASAYIASQSSGKEKTPKALMAIDGVGWDWSYMENKGDDHALVADAEAPTEFALMANTKSKVFDNSLCSNDCKKNNDSLNRYIAVPPPAANLYLSPKKDFLWTGLPEFVDDTVTDYSRPSPTVASTSAEGQNKNSTTSKDVTSPNTPKPFVKFVKLKDSQSESKTNKQETPKKQKVKYAEQYRHSNKKPNVKGNQRNWNNLKSYQLGPEFVLKKKACFNCGDFSHFANECRKRVQRETTRFTWTFFLKSKDETSDILKKFITEIENLKELKVKIIRTLIEAARTMLADAKLPVTFWAEAVNTACYVQNRVLVNKSQNKTPYELFNGRTPSIGFLKPFGCHVMILNTLDNLGKFEAKGDEGNFIRYLMSSKAFMVFNKRTRRVKENLHVEFLENKAIENGAGPNWLFDIDSLTKSMNYVPVDAGTNSTNFPASRWLQPTASTPNPPAEQMETLTVETPIPTVSSPVPTACLNDSLEPSSEARLISKRVANQKETPSLDNILSLTNRFEDILGVTTSSNEAIRVEADVNNMETTISASPTPTLRIHKDHPKNQIIGPVDTPIQTRHKSKATLVDCPKGVRPIGTKWVLKNKKDEKGIVVRNKARLVAQEHTQEEGIDYDEAPRALYGTLSKYLLMNGFQRGTIDQTLFIRRQRRNFILVQVYVDDIIFGSSNLQLCREFKALMHEKFQMTAMGELNFFLGLQVLQKEDGIFLSQDKYVGDILKKFGYSDVRSLNTPMDKENPWGKNGTGKDVDLHLYRSMIGSLMYLTASRPDIMFAVCAYDRHQVTPKECHFHAVKRIFRYLKGHLKLGLWYPKDSPFDLVAYSDSDYGGASQDRKSTSGGCQFLGRWLISW
nr:uncharacterized mitochondrial protein AtMg00810-like [Tanacetum cinerariifolium]